MFEGECVDRVPPASSEVERFAGFLAKLHQFAPQHAPQNSVRGVPLHLRQVPVEERMLRLKHKTDLISDKISHFWSRGLAAAESTECRWLHGDLHAQNVLVNEAGLFSAVIDWGDITSGDVATDLASTWSMFDQSVDRMRLLEIYNPDQATLERAQAWAVLFGVVLADSGLINSPRHAAQGQAILLRLSEDG